VFNAYVLVISTMFLLRLSDLGVGTAVTNAVIEHGPRHPDTERALVSAVRVLTVSSLVMAAISLALTLAGLWEEILGPAAATSGPAVGVAMALYGLGLVPGLGQSILLGANRNHLTVLVLTLFMPLTAVGMVIAVLLDAPGWVAVLLPGVTLAVVRVLVGVMSARVTKVAWGRVLRRVPQRRRFPGARLRATAAPAFVMSISVPLAMQSDRLVLSHVAEDVELTNYSVSVQLFGALLALLVAAAQPLWPMFAKARSQGTPPPSMAKVALGFGGIALAACALIVPVADRVGTVVGGESVQLGLLLPAANGLVVILQVVALPMGMALMYPPAITFLAWCATLALPVNLALSIFLADALGAPGPLLGSVVSATLVQLVPGLLYFRRERQRWVEEGGIGVDEPHVVGPPPGDELGVPVLVDEPPAEDDPAVR
jgi:O-antigen/teichoic acid export membrane protein